MDKIKEDIFGLTEKELKSVIDDLSLPAFRAKQVLDWLYKKQVWDFWAMSNIAKKDQALLSETFTVLPAKTKLLANQLSADGLTNKLLLGLADGNSIETVGMQHSYGYSVCVSSQVGCAMGCSFCASTIGGFTRNLSAAEMLMQVAFFQKTLFADGGRVSSIVIMGAGEPFLNYDEVIKFLRLLHLPEIYNMGFRNITLSTCGLVDGIEKLLAEDVPINLAVSLHAPEDELRSQLMPVNKKHDIATVIKAADQYAQVSGRRITYEYILLKGVNDSPVMAKKLALLLTGKLAAVNIIPVNVLPGKNWQQPERSRVEKFLAVLTAHGIAATVRKEMGNDIKAACGQLKAGYNKKNDGE